MNFVLDSFLLTTETADMKLPWYVRGSVAAFLHTETTVGAQEPYQGLSVLRMRDNEVGLRRQRSDSVKG